MKDYDKYILSKREWFLTGIKGFAILVAVSYLFYNSIYAVILGSPFLFYYIQKEKKARMEARKQQMILEFKEMMHSIATALSAGYALENTFAIAKEDLQRLYPKGDSYLVAECNYIIHNLEVHRTVEELLADLGERSNIIEIKHFARVVSIAKRSGGNMIAILKSSVKQISETLEVKREIAVMVAAKALEQKIMLVMPFAIIAYLRVCNPGYLDVLYGNVMGVFIMSMALAVIGICAYWSQRIMTISV